MMVSWAQFVASSGVGPEASVGLPTDPIEAAASVRVPYVASLEPSQSLLPPKSETDSPKPTMGCMAGDQPTKNDNFVPPETTHNPCRNLTDAFEELYIESPGEVATPSAETSGPKDKLPAALVSPTGVADLHDMKHSEQKPSDTQVLDSFHVPDVQLHEDLQLSLSQALVNRVSFYSVIHDINKEATAMAENDETIDKNQDEVSEEHSPLVIAVNGAPKANAPAPHPMTDAALIDEERWLLAAIELRDATEPRPVQACPATFPEAMGEREYSNPLSAMANTRTQLWKPSRSWWEAKSGKNPWIEPKSHNKRWRYLWPLIHYHKFLAKCIKKLKRNGVDVKVSISPVAVFLREEVCAVSDHLAAVSLFDSEQWMSCLSHFNGWTGTGEESEAQLRSLIAKLKLRSLYEPGDVDSPLLRSQIDEQFLRAMATARAQMAGTNAQSLNRKSAPKDALNAQKSLAHPTDGTAESGASVSQTLPKQHASGPPPLYPRQATGSPYHPSQEMASHSPHGVHRPNFTYPSQAGGWWGHGWGHGHPPPFPYGDDASVHSALTSDSAFQHYSNEFGVYPVGMPHMYFPHQPGATHQFHPSDQSFHNPSMYHAANDYAMANGWAGPNPAYSVPQPSDQTGHGAPPSTPGGSQPSRDTVTGEKAGSMSHAQTPYKYDPNQMPLSPFWGHLDHAAIAAMGLTSPQPNPSPEQQLEEKKVQDNNGEVNPDSQSTVDNNAQPLLLWNPHYYGYGPYGAQEGYGPPSPATQFMMSPQASFAYNYGYGFSPRRPTAQSKPVTPNVPPKSGKNNGKLDDSGRLTCATPNTPKAATNRGSPATVETMAETASLQC